MDRERHGRARAIFVKAFDMNALERDGYLAEACASDAELRAEVEALLAQHTETPTAVQTARLAATGHLEAGALVAGRYRVESELGAGGMGHVYRATQLALRREVALKVLSKDTAASSDTIQRFEREAAAIARLRHPNIVTVYDAGSEPGVGAFIAMELVVGRSLADELADRGRLPLDEALAIMRQVCDAVEAAHRAGVVHRDLKPANVMLEDSDAAPTAKVLDFGIAKLADEAAEPRVDTAAADGAVILTASGAVFGTPLYMSPEQVSGVPVDARTDVWSLGVMLYELLSGIRPFSGRNAPEVFLAILGREPEPLESAANVPAPLARLVERALAKDVDERIQTAGELGRELEVAAPPDGSDALPDRKPATRDTIAARYERLEPDARRAFERLGVFASGCSIEAAEAVCGPGLEGEALLALEALVDEHLIGSVAPEGAEPRLMMLEAVREYARERLDASGEADEIARLHAEYYLAFAERGEGARLAEERDNLRAAFAWLAANRPT